jgi:dUTP pyrophosphatase
MKTIGIKKLSEDAIIPMKATDGAACFDLYIPRETAIQKGRNVIPLDIAIELPHGTRADIRPRSGFSAKGMEDITGCRRDADVLLGTVDEDYKGNIGVIIRSEDYFVLGRGTRVAQMMIADYYPCELVEVEDLSATDRGSNGFGSTGTK